VSKLYFFWFNTHLLANNQEKEKPNVEVVKENRSRFRAKVGNKILAIFISWQREKENTQ
jgi:hypothetical protein